MAMSRKPVWESCVACEKEYKLFSKGSILGEIHYGVIRGKQITTWPAKVYNDYVDHEHVCLCPKCAKAVIEFLKTHFGKGSETSKFWKIGR
jgi:hypothetical protein